jgi:hypothetical protein
LLQSNRFSSELIFELLERKLIVIRFELDKEYLEVAALMKKYKNLPIDLADACLVRMAEKNNNGVVLTLDGDFLVYRKSNRLVLPTILPEEIWKAGVRAHQRFYSHKITDRQGRRPSKIF